MKKKMILIITILIITNMNIISFSQGKLPDVKEHWARDYIEYLVNLEIISGYPDGLFRPDDTIKAGEFTKLLILSLGFSDISNSNQEHWSLNYIRKAVELGIIEENELKNELKDLDKNITRAEMARMISREIPESFGDINEYKDLLTDYDNISSNYQSHVLKCFRAGIISGYPDKEFKPNNNATRAEACTMIIRLLDFQYRNIPILDKASNNKDSVSPTLYESKSFTVNNKTIKVEVITIDIKNPKIKLKTTLAKGTIGSVAALEDIASEQNTVAAINGTYFGAYTEDKEPYGVLVVDGKILHTGTDRSVFGFDKEKNVDIDILMPKIRGYNGEPKWKYSWNGYWLNHTPVEGGESVIVFTPERGEKVRSDLGTNVIVKDGKIVEIAEGNADIPKNGLVVNLYGPIKDVISDRFIVGRPLEYDVDLSPTHGNREFWEHVEGAVGAGPGLVWEGKIALNLEKEKFTEPKITSTVAARSAIGFTNDKKLIMLTTRSATISDLAEVMVRLGCEKAMNLDGGASSGLYYKGKVITKPGRQISNAILVLEEQ